jgi:hypothetical protein
MRRSLFSRVTALFVGLWFVALSAAPEVTHACPMHGSHAAMAALGHSHSGQVAPQLKTHHRAGDDSAPQHGNQCTCLGQCCSAGPVALVSLSTSLADIVTVATRDAGLPDYVYVPVAARHVLPLAHAPPLSA